MKILIISNGNGEDLIGSKLLIELRKHDIEPDVMPLVGKGSFYSKHSANILGRTRNMPSGGFLTSPIAILKDFFAGAIFYHLSQALRLIIFKGKYDKIICVGDVFCMLMGAITKGTAPLYFLPTAKSDYIEPHYKIEEFFIRKYAFLCFSRDEVTSHSLNGKGINCLSLGNVMMDAIDDSGEDFSISTEDVVVGILPGSRKEAYKNFKTILNVLIPLYQNIKKNKLDVTFLISVPASLSLLELKEILNKYGSVLNSRKCIFSDKFGDIISRSDFIIGMAGTANEQAVGLGKPVFTWEGKGPQTSRGRIRDQKKLLGDSLVILDGTDPQKARALWKTVQLPDLYKVCKKNALERMGKKGAARRIVTSILKNYS